MICPILSLKEVFFLFVCFLFWCIIIKSQHTRVVFFYQPLQFYATTIGIILAIITTIKFRLDTFLNWVRAPNWTPDLLIQSSVITFNCKQLRRKSNNAHKHTN